MTFGDQTVSRGRADLRRVVGAYQARLAELPGLDLVPAEWLHLTMQGIGFVDEIGAADAERIVAAGRRRCGALAPVRLTLGPAELQAEGVWLRVTPPAAVRRVRAAVRAGIAEVQGAARVPESAGGFTPHVSLAYSNTDGPDDPYAAALAAVRPRSATVELAAIRPSPCAATPTCTSGRALPRSCSGPGQFVEIPLYLSPVIKRAKRPR